MENPTPEQVTQLLVDWNNGNQEALELLVPLVRDTLRRLARNMMKRERQGHTLQTSALINEAYIRLLGARVNWQNRAHFFGIAARLMRQILVDYARARNYEKRRGVNEHVPLDDAITLAQDQSPEHAIEILALDEALTRMSAFDPRQAQIVEMRFFGGMTIEETAQALNISHTTVEREWALARVWLRDQLSK